MRADVETLMARLRHNRTSCAGYAIAELGCAESSTSRVTLERLAKCQHSLVSTKTGQSGHSQLTAHM